MPRAKKSAAKKGGSKSGPSKAAARKGGKTRPSMWKGSTKKK